MIDAFYVKVDPNSSKQLQELAFKKGYKWRSGGFQYLDKPYLYFMGKLLGFCDDDWTDGSYVKVTLEEALIRLGGEISEVSRHNQIECTCSSFQLLFGEHTCGYKS